MRDRTRTIATTLGAVAVGVVATVVASAAWNAGAAPGDDDATYVAIDPCRLWDDRPAPNNVGGRVGAIGEGGTVVQQVTGEQGNCTGAFAVPADAVGVALNVTIANPTAQSNLRLYPGNVDALPVVSNLNWVAGQSPTPNKVDVKLSPSGTIKVSNFKGSVNTIGDVVGYYTSSSLKELDARIDRLDAVQFAALYSQVAWTNTPLNTGTVAEIARAEITLPDVCPGPDTWQVYVEANGMLQSNGTETDGTLGLSTDGTFLTSNTERTQSFATSAGVFNNVMSTSHIYEVDAGTRTFIAGGGASINNTLIATTGTITAHAISVVC
ncbi:MAG: hypothetical protein AAFY28_16520 [Actinomycetota bacterium]